MQIADYISGASSFVALLALGVSTYGAVLTKRAVSSAADSANASMRSANAAEATTDISRETLAVAQRALAEGHSPEFSYDLQRISDVRERWPSLRSSTFRLLITMTAGPPINAKATVKGVCYSYQDVVKRNPIEVDLSERDMSVGESIQWLYETADDEVFDLKLQARIESTHRASKPLTGALGTEPWVWVETRNWVNPDDDPSELEDDYDPDL